MKARIVTTAAVIIVLAGCSSTVQKPIVGVAESGVYLNGATAPDIVFTTLQGQPASFRKLSEPIAILAFTDSSGQGCCRLVPELVTLAHRFRNEPITVAQISLPTSQCPYGPGCAQCRNVKDANLALLYDANRTYWQAYGQPEPGTVFLIDEERKVIAVENLCNIESIGRQAERLSDRLEEMYSSMYEGE